MPLKNFAILGVSLTFIFAGAKMLIDSIQYLALNFGVGEEIIAGTVLSVGTTLPEFMVSISAVRRRKPEIVMGNIVGSNIFNILGVIGISGMLGTIIVPETILTFAYPVLVAAVILYFFIVWDKKITRWEGAILLILYIFYVGKLFKLF